MSNSSWNKPIIDIFGGFGNEDFFARLGFGYDFKESKLVFPANLNIKRLIDLGVNDSLNPLETAYIGLGHYSGLNDLEKTLKTTTLESQPLCSNSNSVYAIANTFDGKTFSGCIDN
ncbi:hypothetical protein [uncultured Pseudoteredinibacter sp.]|uniref:hypothetical protein n=1 Tax=uncultured Pseudoteredinibacter sp. TaxID=1641701 RepID=UPI002607FFA8|nr:hypothetical protein [uncultured Pseudoteredinibacter sp.]